MRGCRNEAGRNNGCAIVPPRITQDIVSQARIPSGSLATQGFERPRLSPRGLLFMRRQMSRVMRETARRKNSFIELVLLEAGFVKTIFMIISNLVTLPGVTIIGKITLPKKKKNFKPFSGGATIGERLKFQGAKI